MCAFTNIILRKEIFSMVSFIYKFDTYIYKILQEKNYLAFYNKKK